MLYQPKRLELILKIIKHSPTKKTKSSIRVNLGKINKIYQAEEIYKKKEKIKK